MDLVTTSVVILAAAAVAMYRLVLWVEKFLNRFWGKDYEKTADILLLH